MSKELDIFGYDGFDPTNKNHREEMGKIMKHQQQLVDKKLKQDGLPNATKKEEEVTKRHSYRWAVIALVVTISWVAWLYFDYKNNTIGL